jgi:aspartyl protease family protein
VNDGTAPLTVYYVLAIILVASSLIGMQMPIGKAAKMALAWVAIFGIGFTLFSFRSEFSALGDRLYASATGAPVELEGGELRVDMAEDGHFWVAGKVNGESVRFLVDSGASTTTLSAETAAKAGIVPSGRRSAVNTANGQIIVALADAGTLAIGPIERTDFPVNVSSSDGVDILGMNFLSSLDSWRVERGALVMRP